MKTVKAFHFKRTNYFKMASGKVGEKRYLRRSCILEARSGGAKPQRPATLHELVLRSRQIESASTISDPQ